MSQVAKLLFRDLAWWSHRVALDDPNGNPEDWIHDDDTDIRTCDEIAVTQVIAAGGDVQGEDL